MNAASAGQPAPVTAVPAALPLPPAPVQIQTVIEDRVSGRLTAIAAPEIQAALHLPSDHAAADASIHRAVDALAHHDVAGAVRAVGELLRTQPEAEARVLNEPALAPIRQEIRDVATHLTVTARQDAEKTLAHAGALVAAQPPGAFGPTTVALANQFLETGQYVNYIRAGELGRLAISSFGPPHREVMAESRLAGRIAKAAGSLWRRAPLLALLLAWIIPGFVVALVNPELWAVGFLALIVFQFMFTVRNRNRR